MTVQILFFGITTDLLNTSSIELEMLENSTVVDLKATLINKYPALKKLKSYAVAVNESYANDEVILNSNDVVAIIPPVSGG